MRLTIIAQIYNELQTGNLVRFFKNSKFADNFIIYDDGSDDGTEQEIDNCEEDLFPDMYYIRSDKNDFKNEIQHKQEMLEKAIEIGSDWILWLDADEIIENAGQKGGLREELENIPKDIDGLSFHQINMWRSDRFYRLDNQYNDGWFIRAWRNNGRLRYDSRPGLHQRQYPLGVDKVVNSKFQVIHYGFSSDINILRKYSTYKAHGQTGWELQRLVDESTLALRRINPNWLSEPMTGPTEDIFKQKLVDLI